MDNVHPHEEVEEERAQAEDVGPEGADEELSENGT